MEFHELKTHPCLRHLLRHRGEQTRQRQAGSDFDSRSQEQEIHHQGWRVSEIKIVNLFIFIVYPL